ncbi:MAG: hypothetical protein IJI45_16575 [Anaerolineaceae bacterium]|nr:hypothetical protein [Anaerolineaceae bacterium]
MKILLHIPSGYEDEYKRDQFVDSLSRLIEDAHLLAGNYEKETAYMLIDALKTAQSLKE